MVGAPLAAFPYCLSCEEYVRQMTEVARKGLNDDHTAGYACIDCGQQLGPDRVKVGRNVLHWRREDADGDGDTYTTDHDLYACPRCAELIKHPAWCDRNHLPLVQGHKWLDSAIHRVRLGEVRDAINSSADPEEVTLIAFEGDEGIGDHYNNPFVLGSRLFICLSCQQAARSARAKALNNASIL